jgi:hypothetical protein
VTYTVTLNSPDKNVVLPNGTRYQGSAAVVLSDQEYSMLSPTALASLMSAVPAGGTASYTATLSAGLKSVVLPDGLMHKGGDVVVLSDTEYSTMTPNAIATLFSSVVRTVI